VTPFRRRDYLSTPWMVQLTPGVDIDHFENHWSSQTGEIYLQKYLPVSGKQSITKFLKRNAVDCRSRLTVENTLKVEEKVYYFENKHNSSSPLKKLGYA